jgi:acyl-coenzyme A synthetase/AMP-(fatty) acid ligase
MDWNASAPIREHAAARPNEIALITPGSGVNWTSTTWAKLDDDINRYAHGFAELGIERGTRVLFLIKPGVDFYACLFAMYRIGAIPVLIDPGMGLKGVLSCIEQIQPTAVLALPMVHAVRVFKRKPFASANIFITAGARWFWGGKTLSQCVSTKSTPYTTNGFDFDEEAFIAFTSGSTGPAKGVSFTHGMIRTQARLIGEHYGLKPGTKTVECFAAFLIYDLLIGLTVVMPDMNMSKPATADPRNIARAITEHQADAAFASPVVWTNLTRYAEGTPIKLPSLQRVLTAGAPIQPDMHRRFAALLNDGVQLFTPYGATESLPIASIGSTHILEHTAELTAKGHGTCIGTLFKEVEARIVRISEEPMPVWSDDLAMPVGEIGEIVAHGRMVSPQYKDRPDANALAKIEIDGRIAHRMGDLGYFDEQGRLWFCGRKSHRLETPDGMIPAVPVEGIYNDHPDVLRSALVGVGERGAEVPILLVELEEGKAWSAKLETELAAMAAGSRWEDVVQRIMQHPGFPTDPRHNSKIKREQLKLWAAEHAASVAVAA